MIAASALGHYSQALPTTRIGDQHDEWYERWRRWRAVPRWTRASRSGGPVSLSVSSLGAYVSAHARSMSLSRRWRGGYSDDGCPWLGEATLLGDLDAAGISIDTREFRRATTKGEFCRFGETHL